MTNERERLRGVVGSVLVNASNFPAKVQSRILGQDMDPLINRTVDAILAAGFGDVAAAWDMGEQAGSDNQVNWDGWNYIAPPVTNPYRAPNANGGGV